MSSHASPSGRRKTKTSLFNRTPSALAPLTPITDASSPQKLRQKSPRVKSPAGKLSTAFSSSSSLSSSPADTKRKSDRQSKVQNGHVGSPASSRRGSAAAPSESPAESESPRSSRPSFGKRGRPSSIFGSLRSLRFGDDEETPSQSATSVSSRAPSLWKEFASEVSDVRRSSLILHHSEAQTSTGWFWKKREYLVLTESHLIRFKNRGKANEAFPTIPLAANRQEMLRHSPSRSMDSSIDQQSLLSEVSGEKSAGIALESIVAVYLTEDGRSAHSLEVSYVDNDAGQSCSITFHFTDADERDLWLKSIREAANKARLSDPDPVPVKLAEYVSRFVEREQDYEPSNIKIYKIVKRATSKSNGRASADDSAKTAPIVCFFVIGLHKVHIIPLPKHSTRGSSTSLSDHADGGSFGILNLTWISVNTHDDSFALAFRFPFQAPRAFSVASLASSEIALQLRERDGFLRPEWIRRPFAFSMPSRPEDEAVSEPQPGHEDLNCFDRTLTAFCVAYGVNPNKICYSVNYFAEDSPQFELLPPSYLNHHGYSPLEVLAVLRALRYNEHFKSISFAHVNLGVLNGLRDFHGVEHVCTHTKSGAAIRISREELEGVSLLISEIRAIAVSSHSLRRMNFSYSMLNSALTGLRSSVRAPSCEVLEALYPLCRDQLTDIDWLCLNGIPLTENDLEFLISMAANRACHLRALELSNCGLSDMSISLILDALKAQSGTLECIDISLNASKQIQPYFETQLETFSYIRKLDLSGMAISSSSESFLPIEVLSQWRLEELRLHGVTLNDQSVQTICRYLGDLKSALLRELILSNCNLNGRHVWDIMHALKLDAGTARLVHLDLSENRITDGHDNLVRAIARSMAPTHLTMRSLEYDNENKFAELVFALAQNKSIRYLDISRVSLPGEASPETCSALEELFTNNVTLEDLDISGEVSRLEVTKFGVGFVQALKGLRRNTALQVLKIKDQKLGLQGASALGDVLRENKTLKQLHCENNGITLSGFTDIVNALAYNRTLLYMPSLEEGRHEALMQTETQIKLARNRTDENTTSSPSKLSGVRRTIAKIGSSDGGSSSNASRLPSVPQWSEQDVRAALRLVDEGWEGQMVRLHAFLDRNNKIAQGIPLEDPEDVDEEEQHRPGTAGSFSKVMEKVTYETTPTIEKFVELGVQESKPLEPAQATLATDGRMPRAATSPNLETTSSPLGDLEIDRTPMLERGNPFEYNRHEVTTVSYADENDPAFLSPMSPPGGSVLELKLPPSRVQNVDAADA